MIPKIVAVAATKGGVGKTTIALQLAIARAKQDPGHDVWLVDGDRQQTAQTALSLRGQQDLLCGIGCAAYEDGAQLRAQVNLQKGKWDSIIIDVGGKDSTTLRAALSICDLLVLPFQPRSFDVWALAQMSNILTETWQYREPFPVYAFLNCADPAKSPDNLEAAAALADFPEMTYLDTPIRRRKAIATASGYGLGVSEMKTRDAKAVKEINDLVTAVFRDIEVK